MKQFVLFIVVIVSNIQIGSCQIAAEWRGIGRTGIYDQAGLLESWPENGPELLWSCENLPEGNSSASVANNSIFFTGIVDTMDYLIATDMQGKLRWQSPIGVAWNSSYPNSRSTPTIEGNRAYVTSGSGYVACVNTEDGTIIWQLNASKKFEGSFARWGIAESPLLVDDKVIFTPCGNKTTLVALDKMTGETIWESESLQDNPAYTSPIVIQKNKLNLIVALTASYLIGVDAKDGRIIWSEKYVDIDNKRSLEVWDKAPYTNCNTPIYHNGNIYVTSGYNHVGAMFGLSKDLMQIDFKWSDSTLDVHHGGAVLVDGYIYGSNWINNRNGNWCCINWETGETAYQAKWMTKGSIIAANGYLYCYEEKSGNLALVKAKPDGFSVISSFKIPLGSGPHWSHPVIKDGILYVRHGDALMAYNIKQ